MLNKVQMIIAKSKLKALLTSKGDGVIKGLKFREGSRSFSIEEVQLRTNLPLMNLKLDSIESLELNHKDYQFYLVIKGLEVNTPEGEFSVEEVVIETFLELKEFILEIKGITEALAEEK